MMTFQLRRGILRYLKRHSFDRFRSQSKFNCPGSLLYFSDFANSTPYVGKKQLNDFPNTFKSSKRYIRPQDDKDILPNEDSDVFGNLSEELKFEDKIESLPDEEDDVITRNYVDDKIGKTRLSTKQYADLIKKHLAEKKLVDALDILEVKMLQEDRVKPENYIYNLLIDACAKVGYTKKAFKLYNDMKKRGLKVTGATYTSLFNSCALSPVPGDGLERAQHLRELIMERQILLNRSNYHSMMKAFGRCGDIGAVFEIVDEMISKRVTLKSDTFCFLLQACITNNTHGFRHAILVWRKMRERKVKPTVYCYNLILRCARDCHIGDSILLTQDLKLITSHNKDRHVQKLLPDGSMKDLQSLPRSNSEEANLTLGPVLPNLLSENPQMGSVSSIKQISKPKHRLMLLGDVAGFLSQMKMDNVDADIKTATLLLDLIPSTNQAEYDLLKHMEKANIKLDIDFCNLLMRKRCMRHDYIASREVLNLISRNKLVPNLLTFGVLALTCRNTKDTIQFLHDLKDAGFRANIEIVGGLVCAARHSWNLTVIMMVMELVLKEEMNISHTFIKHLEKFKQHIKTQINMKDQGLDYHEIINGESFLEDYDKFLVKYKMFMNLAQIDNKDKIHPWNQYRKPKLIETFTRC